MIKRTKKLEIKNNEKCIQNLKKETHIAVLNAFLQTSYMQFLVGWGVMADVVGKVSTAKA